MENVRLGRVKVYELSREFWECRAFRERVALPPKLLEKDMEDDAWFCRASFTERELYRLLLGLEKFTDALKEVPGCALESWEWLQRMPKLVLC